MTGLATLPGQHGTFEANVKIWHQFLGNWIQVTPDPSTTSASSTEPAEGPTCDELYAAGTQEHCECQGYEWMPGIDGQEPYCSGPPPTPILLPTSKRGTRQALYTLTSVANGVLFDIDGDGIKEWTAWTTSTADVGFLALDRDGDGFITSGKELYGNHTMLGKINGFQVLTAEVGVGVAAVDARHALYHKLLIWIDRSHDGESQPDELYPLKQYYSRIGTGYGPDTLVDEHGNQFRWRGWAQPLGKSSRETIPIYDVILVQHDESETGRRRKARR